MRIMNLISLPLPTEAREELSSAQFILKDKYIDWAWDQRVKENPPSRKRSRGKWPFVRNEDNVIPLKKVRG